MYAAMVELTFSAAIHHWAEVPPRPQNIFAPSVPKWWKVPIWNLHENGLVLPYPKNHDLLWRQRFCTNFCAEHRCLTQPTRSP